jgi:anthranilate phosphoribosyltransferase
MRAHSLPCVMPDCVDIVGTGGDGIDTFNVSTCAAIIVAGAGRTVMKHGNRSNSSKCGSADILEALGARMDVDGRQAQIVGERSGFCFLFAQKFHPAMRFVGPPRKEMGITTIFNILGPLTNPCVPRWQVAGICNQSIGPMYARSLMELGLERAFVVMGFEGLDEVSPQGPTHVWECNRQTGEVEYKVIRMADFGLSEHLLTSPGILGGYPHENKQVLLNILDGKETGPVLDYVLANAALALHVSGKASCLLDAVALARASIASGAARRALDAYVAATHAVFAEAAAEKEQLEAKMTILDRIACHRALLIAEDKKALPQEEMISRAFREGVVAPMDVLARVRQAMRYIAIMAEIKRASPSKGIINDKIDVVQQALTYAQAGAAVISVLCEPKWFKGSVADLRRVASALQHVPNRPAVLMKDFVEDEYHLLQGRCAGADTALLIVARLPLARLQTLIAYSRKLGMEPLVEVATADEMATALAAGAEFIGVNNRDLHTFTLDASRTVTLMAGMDCARRERVTIAALSGIASRADVEVSAYGLLL